MARRIRSRAPRGAHRGPRSRTDVRLQRANGVVALLFSLLIASMAASAWDVDRTLGGSAARTAPATVTQVHDCTGRCDPFVVVRFATSRGVTTVDLHDVDWDPVPQVGDVLTVRYDEEDPAVYIRDERLADDRVGPVLLAALAAGLGVVGVAGLALRLPQWFLDYRR